MKYGLKYGTIQKEDKQGINELVEILNKVDNLGYSLTDEWLDYVVTGSRHAMSSLAEQYTGLPIDFGGGN